ncbi:MAG: endonuclease/exonuclease/phosphatase family protein [Planctomycetota bacterium]
MQKPMNTLGILSLAFALSAAPLSWQDGAPAAPAAPKAPAKEPKAPAKEKAPPKEKAPKTVRPAGVWYGVEKAPEKKDGAIRIAAYNVENFFDGVDDPALQGEYDDIKMTTKPTRVQAIADEIKRLDADILCLEEMESLEALTWFRDTYLKDMGYKYVYSEDVGYYRGVEQACLSRFPIKAHTTFVTEDLTDMDAMRDGEGWAGKKPDQAKKFQRSPLKLEIDVNGWPVTIYSVHFKAGGKEFDYQRESEALQTIEFVKKDLEANPAANVAVMGDFNATPSMKTPKAFGESGMKGAYDFRANKDSGTKDLYTTHDSGRAIDYIFMSKGLADDVLPGGFFVMGTMHPASDYDWKTDPEKEKVPAGYASDHCPVAVDVMPKDGAPKAAPAPAAKPG